MVKEVFKKRRQKGLQGIEGMGNLSTVEVQSHNSAAEACLVGGSGTHWVQPVRTEDEGELNEILKE